MKPPAVPHNLALDHRMITHGPVTSVLLAIVNRYYGASMESLVSRNGRKHFQGMTTIKASFSRCLRRDMIRYGLRQTIILHVRRERCA